MRKFTTTLMLAALSVLFVTTGCTKKKDDAPAYTMTSKLGANSFTTSNCYATSSAGTLMVVGTNGTNTSATYPIIQLFIPEWNGNTGNFAIDTSSAVAPYAQYVISASDYDIAVSGSINITSVTTTTISGNFSFVGLGGTNYSGGNFTAKRY